MGSIAKTGGPVAPLVSLACGGVAGGLRQSGGSLFWMQVAGGGITSDEVDHTAQSIAAWARDL